MSEMEMFIGCFEEAEDQSIFPEDTDDFLDFEEEEGCHFVKVNDKVFKFWKILEVDPYGFTETIPVQERPIVICYWYNGGAGLHEVVKSAIQSVLDRNEE